MHDRVQQGMEEKTATNDDFDEYSDEGICVWDIYQMEMDLEEATEKWEFEALLGMTEQRLDDRNRLFDLMVDRVKTEQSNMARDTNDITQERLDKYNAFMDESFVEIHELHEEEKQIMQLMKHIASKYTEFLREEDKVNYNGHKETEDDRCDESKSRHDRLQQGDGREETEGRNRETVDTGETNPSTGSKRLDHQHQQESTDTEKGPTLMIECTANKGIHRINMEINHTMRQKKKIYVRPTIYEVKHATCKRKKKCKHTQIKPKQTVIQRNQIHWLG